MTISIYAHKGGVGVTTVAAALAMVEAHKRAWPHAADPVTILAERAEIEDLCAVLGAPQPTDGPDGSPQPCEVGQLTLYDLRCGSLIGEPPDFIVGYRGGAGVTRYVVSRCGYLEARKESRRPMREERADGLILVMEPGRALTPRDMEAATGVPVVAEIPWDPAVARAIDAGLLAARMPASLTRPLGAIRPKENA